MPCSICKQTGHNARSCQTTYVEVKPVKAKSEKKTIQKMNVPSFTHQVIRKDILTNILLNKNLLGKEIFALIMSDNNSSPTPSRMGGLYEALVEIMVLMKCVNGINYTKIMEGDLSAPINISNCKMVLNKKIHQGGNVSDISIMDGECLIVFSCKYNKDKVSKKATDANDLYSTVKRHTSNYKVGLFLRDKKVIRASKKNDIHKEVVDAIEANHLIFDEQDLVKALDTFRSKFSGNIMAVDDFIELVINADYLLSSRKQLVLKLHQKMTEIKIVKSYLTNKHKMWCIAHKPRSGKSITILTICKYLLENGLNKILIMTSVPATITNFIEALEEYVDFKNINYKRQEEFESTDEQFKGIVFCSVQYLKTDGKISKKDILKRIGFELIIMDECHLGGSTDKTRSEIIDVESDIAESDIVEDIRKGIRLSIFVSGTADKTIRYYRIKPAEVSEWEIIDEGHMKNKKEENISFMIQRHGPVFRECLENTTLNQDYSIHPSQVLMKYSIPVNLIREINEYNAKYGTNYGYSCSSLFALCKAKKQEPERDKDGKIKKTKDGNDYYEYEYVEKFELDNDNDGKELLKGFFKCVISEPMEKNTIMKCVEATQSSRSSRKSSTETPMLFIIYLPTHTGNNTISALQKTFKQFLKDNGLWSQYNIEYSSSSESSSFVKKQEYNDEIAGYMKKTKKENKRGCILLLGNKGSVGITYDNCDVTISLDDGHNIDNQKQRFSRALTDAPGKTIGINVDMNIQRTYLYLIDMIHKHRKSTNTKMTNAEVLQYLYEHNIFLFNPQQFNNGKCTTHEIVSYYHTEAENIMKEIDDIHILENIECDDTIRDLIKMDYTKSIIKRANEEIEGGQQDCPKGDKTKVLVDRPNVPSQPDDDKLTPEITEMLINQTYELCKGFLFPVLALISRSFKIHDFKDLFERLKTSELMFSLLTYKIENLNRDKYILIKYTMTTILDRNAEIVNNIREIYRMASPQRLRNLIEKHFIPTQEEKKGNAEVPTPVKLVDDMLDQMPSGFWKTPQKVFEPCCGKGNFVLGIFDRFFKGLEEMYPDVVERCRVIMTVCIYYADLTMLNVFITTEIMKCHIQSYCKLEELDYEFNHYTGDTLKLNVVSVFGITGFNAVIGNPPYNDDSGNKGKGHTLWTVFIEKSLQQWLNVDGYLLFVNPSLWRQPEHPLQKIMKSKQIIYLEIHDEKDGFKTFRCNTRYDVYLIQNKPYDTNTIVKTQKGEIENVDLREWDFIPNYKFSEIKKIIDNRYDKINILYSRSDYASDKKWTKKEKSNIHIFPVAYSVNRANELKHIWSEINDKGHYGIPKVIFGSGATGFIVDNNGDFACSEFCTGIVDDVENLENIKTVLNSAAFKEIILATSVSKAEINRKILKYFKKDFWKDFI